jgi:hypothetical protein
VISHWVAGRSCVSPSPINGDVEKIAGLHLHDVAIIHRGRGASRDNGAHVLDVAARFSKGFADMGRPLPA